ncbi:MAG: hypothetical protein GF307_09310 [candidate division Zixibacteria bacterium]|nr:hypothetical protein [candidate division Zixibacteria bacterium]
MNERPVEYYRVEMLNTKRCVAISDDFLKSILKLTPLSENDSYRFRVAISEIVSNSYRHGNKEDPNKKIYILCTIDKNCIKVVIEDEGNGFDLSDAGKKYEIEGIYAPGGRGLKIAGKFADNVEYEINETGRFSVSLVKNFELEKNKQKETIMN